MAGGFAILGKFMKGYGFTSKNCGLIFAKEMESETVEDWCKLCRGEEIE